MHKLGVIFSGVIKLPEFLERTEMSKSEAYDNFT